MGRDALRSNEPSFRKTTMEFVMDALAAWPSLPAVFAVVTAREPLRGGPTIDVPPTASRVEFAG
jgi:hypothetical protein